MTTDPMDSYALGLYWGVKRSFMQYVSRMPDGRIWVGDGAMAGPEAEILFAPESDESSVVDGVTIRVLKFVGAAQFAGHGGMLRLELRNPWIVLRDGMGELSVMAPGDPQSRVVLLTFELSEQSVNDGVEFLVAEAPVLGEAGVLLFNEVYSVGEPFDQLIVAGRYVAA